MKRFDFCSFPNTNLHCLIASLRRCDVAETLCEILARTGLEDDLDGEIWTVFAPTNDAFDSLPDGVLDSLLNNTDALTDLLLFHTIAGEALNLTQFECGEMTDMANEESSTTVCEPGRIFQTGAGNSPSEMPVITGPDIQACNGIVHMVRYGYNMYSD
jgi:transforming growth factor-beta-induced protein